MRGGHKCPMPLPPQTPGETPALMRITGQPVFTPVPHTLLGSALPVPLKWGTIMGPALTTGMWQKWCEPLWSSPWACQLRCSVYSFSFVFGRINTEESVGSPKGVLGMTKTRDRKGWDRWVTAWRWATQGSLCIKGRTKAFDFAWARSSLLLCCH